MPVELIVSPPATGKTAACIQRIQALRSSQPLARIFVVVPDRLQAAAFRRRLANSGGALGTYVGTFRDLFKTILENAGVFLPQAASPLLHYLIQSILDEAAEAGELAYFAPLQFMPGFVLTLREAFAELKRAFVTPAELIGYTQNLPPAQKELASLYLRYQSKLREIGWIDADDFGWLALQALDQQPQFAASLQLLLVDGFDTFTGVHFQALKTLAGQVADLVITLPGSPGSKRPVHRRFAHSLDRLVTELAPRVIAGSQKRYLPAHLAQLEKFLFEIQPTPIEKQGDLFLLEARAPADEAREALRWIKKLVLRQEVRLADCVIFTPNPELYNPLLRACAGEFGIPIRFTQAEPLSNSTAISALLNLLQLPAGNFNTRRLFNSLRSPYFDFSLDAASLDQLEVISRVAQITAGLDQWAETWDRLAALPGPDADDFDDERVLPGLPRGPEVEKLRAPLDACFRLLAPPAGQQTEIAWITWLEDLLNALGFIDRTNDPRDELAYEALQQTLRSMLVSETVLHRRAVDYGQFVSDLQATLSTIDLPEPSLTGEPALLVGRIAEARGVRYQAVALLGFSEGSFPVVERADPFLDETLRAGLGLDPRLQRGQVELFYQAVTRADRFVLITRPYLSEDGEAWEESAYWKAILPLFQHPIIETIRPDDPRPLADAGSNSGAAVRCRPPARPAAEI